MGKEITLWNKRIKINWLFWAIFLGGCIVRLFLIGEYPKGLFTDETSEAWEAYNLAVHGFDSWGAHNPVYFKTVNGGMSALNGYLMIPFIKIFGATNFALRLPHAIISCFSLVSIYYLFLKVTNRFCANLALFILAVNPWHIMVARWALDCNLAPEMLLIGTTFFIYGLDKRKYMIFAALFYGLSLYCYAAIWPVMPLILILEAIYAAVYKKVRIDRYVVVSLIVIVVMAVPLLLFIMVNLGVIGEIRTPFLSIPKIHNFRAGEVGSSGLWGILYRVFEIWRVVIEQDDGLIWNTLPKFGLYYKFSIPIILIGFVECIQNVWKMIRSGQKGEFSEISVIILIHLCAFLIQGCLIEANINTINGIHIPVICLNVLGIYGLQKYFCKDMVWLVLTGYLFSFVAFQAYYYSNYTQSLGYTLNYGLEDAVAYAETLNEDVYVKENLAFWEIIYFLKPDIYEYMEKIEEAEGQAWQNEERVNLKEYGKFHFGEINKYELGNAYMIKREENELVEQLESMGFEIEIFEHIVVAH